MSHWLQTLRRVGERGLDAVIVTVTSGKGSTPREAGAKMVVTVDALHGSIGGGELEYQATDIARGLLRAGPRDKGVGKSSEPRDSSPPEKVVGKRSEPEGLRTERFSLGASLGQYCGGAADLLFERVPAGAEWVRVAADWLDAGKACVVVTPTDGADDGHLVVGTKEAWGRLDGGERDAGAKEIARRMLADRERVTKLAPLDGEAAALFEPLEVEDFNVVLFGAGHVGRSLVRVLGTLACRITWVDSRAGEFPVEKPDNARVVLTDTPAAEVSRADPGSYFLVMTHSHALDFVLLEAILRREDVAFCGMIGSQTKRRTFENGLAKRGLSPAVLARLTCPIGIPGIKGKEPGTIAVAVAAQLLEHRERAVAARETDVAASD
jgi:xanthine dehydrogenase accessory factor